MSGGGWLRALGRWCAVEPGLAGTDWAYCAPAIDYGRVRSAVEVGFAAKAEEAHRQIMCGAPRGCGMALDGVAWGRLKGQDGPVGKGPCAGLCSSFRGTSRLRSSSTMRPPPWGSFQEFGSWGWYAAGLRVRGRALVVRRTFVFGHHFALRVGTWWGPQAEGPPGPSHRLRGGVQGPPVNSTAQPNRAKLVLPCTPFCSCLLAPCAVRPLRLRSC